MILKFVEEQPKPIDLAKLEARRERLENIIICRHCGAENSIVGSYRSVAYGTCRIHRNEGVIQEDDHEDQDWDPAEVTFYQCVDCGAESGDIDDVILGEGEEFVEPPLQDYGADDEGT
jgi:hypothetical protein